jgi:hypothetical protein
MLYLFGVKGSRVLGAYSSGQALCRLPSQRSLREQREGIASTILQINESNRTWIRRNLRKHLDSVFSEIGFCGMSSGYG